jgi:diadenosine tetraphosphatase ApaH/serine/threonine PP2A family protein phosphatase
VLVRGNHEQMLADIMRGSREWFGAWIDNGGEATARSFGLSAISRSMDVFAHEISEAAPYLLRWMLDTLPYARWRDILFVHAGLVPGASIADLPNDDGQLWDNQLFLPTRGLPGEPAFAKYVAEGVKRIIVGHIPLPGVIRVLHGGSTLMIDTNAPGTLYTSRHKQLPGALTLVRPDTSPLFDKVHRVTVPTVG